MHRRSSQKKYQKNEQRYARVPPGVPLFEQASRDAKVRATVHEGVDRLYVDFGITGIDRKTYFYHVVGCDKEGVELTGFVDDADTIGD